MQEVLNYEADDIGEALCIYFSVSTVNPWLLAPIWCQQEFPTWCAMKETIPCKTAQLIQPSCENSMALRQPWGQAPLLDSSALLSSPLLLTCVLCMLWSAPCGSALGWATLLCSTLACSILCSLLLSVLVCSTPSGKHSPVFSGKGKCTRPAREELAYIDTSPQPRALVDPSSCK